MIYFSPADIPDKWVARRWVTMQGDSTPRPDSVAKVASSYKELMEMLPPDMFRLQRDPKDDGCIVESWIV